ncbi:hypothetical protein CVV43_01300 [Candidatus Saccharibacteria bacterium HGW-Saccharibacteria-1]|jgi:surface antigen|nr:MAG: hypothetical protein CVV43_01300 [Candidatus Saccharibacteria bacterium HGW-Saccharibacteria-1]
MKLRSTTPASINLPGKMLLVLSILVIAAAVPIQMMSRPALADEYDDKISALQSEIAQFKAESDRLNSQAASLQNALAQLGSEKAAIQTQIDLSQAKHDKLVADITATEKKIVDNQDALGTTIANLYVDDKISPIEMIASSSNISEFMDKQEYRNSVRDQLTSTISKIKELKAMLSTQKADVEKVLADQKEQRSSLAAKQNEQQSLLDKTKGDEASYQQMIGNNQAAIAEAKATQALMNARFASAGGGTLIDTGSLGDYPWNQSNCWMSGYWSMGGADGNGGDGRGYGCRQCASYVAWKIAKVTGKYYSWGNAVNFTQSAINAGYKEGAPQAGSIAVMDPATSGASEGHVAWVEAVNGNTITISQYNYNYGAGYGMYSMMNMSASAFDHYVHIK